MTEHKISLIDMPEWLRNCDKATDMWYNSKDAGMSEPYHPKYFKETDEINSFEDFLLVLNVCLEFRNDLPKTIFEYASNNREQIKKFVIDTRPEAYSYHGVNFISELNEVLSLSSEDYILYKDLQNKMYEELNKWEINKVFTKEDEVTVGW